MDSELLDSNEVLLLRILNDASKLIWKLNCVGTFESIWNDRPIKINDGHRLKIIVAIEPSNLPTVFAHNHISFEVGHFNGRYDSLINDIYLHVKNIHHINSVADILKGPVRPIAEPESCITFNFDKIAFNNYIKKNKF